MTGILGTAISGLMAFQRSLETTSNNIANVNTEGYSRQRVELGTSLPKYSGAGYIGTGVKIENISRSYDQFINGQLRSSTSAFGEVDSYQGLATQIDNLLADPSTGMEPAVQSFFNAANDVANDPSSIAARDVMLTEGKSLVFRFASVSGQFGALRGQVNADLKSMTGTINTYTKSIADLNNRISADLGRANSQQQPNDLLDERDVALNKLAELVDVSVIPQTNGMVSVVMGNGQPLVMDAKAVTLATQGNTFDPAKLEITLSDGNNPPQLITEQITGGQLAGSLRFRSEILDPAQQKIGAIAAAIAVDFNAIHEVGYDLDGTIGTPFFKFTGTSEVPATSLPSNTGAATVTAAFGANSADLNTSDYLLQYNGANYTLTRVNDNTTITLTDTAGVLTATAPDVLPGITLNVAGAPNANDQFFIRPTYQAASNLAMNITDPRKIAAATNLDAGGAVVAGAMPGDNRNMLLLADLANTSGMFGKTASFQDAYGQIVSKVGGLTHAANISATAQQAVLDRANEARQNISGVNLDEEAANLIKFQQSYQAAAQTISIASSLFDSLLGAVR